MTTILIRSKSTIYSVTLQITSIFLLKSGLFHPLKCLVLLASDFFKLEQRDGPDVYEIYTTPTSTSKVGSLQKMVRFICCFAAKLLPGYSDIQGYRQSHLSSQRYHMFERFALVHIASLTSLKLCTLVLHLRRGADLAEDYNTVLKKQGGCVMENSDKTPTVN